MIQIVLSAVIALVVALLGTPVLIRMLSRRNLAQAMMMLFLILASDILVRYRVRAVRAGEVVA